MTNKRNGTLYVGVTSCLQRRVLEHKNSMVSGFSKRYDCKQLVFYEQYETMEVAIFREKQIKAGPRLSKVALIEETNYLWADLYDQIFGK